MLADGSLVHGQRELAPDLFWALRGGGGNFGVVTSFTFRCHDVGGTVIAGPMLYDSPTPARCMRWYREFLPTAAATS